MTAKTVKITKTNLGRVCGEKRVPFNVTGQIGSRDIIEVDVPKNWYPSTRAGYWPWTYIGLNIDGTRTFRTQEKVKKYKRGY